MTTLYRNIASAHSGLGEKRVDIGIIEGTCLEIDELEGRWQAEREARDARRRKIHQIDELIEEFERLNLAEEAEIPLELKGRAVQLVRAEAHPTGLRPAIKLTVAEWMDALYDVQDTLMIPMEDDLD
jgi:hypothetical protein